MNEKPTRWEYVTTIIVLLLCASWAWYDYQNDKTKIPFEPMIAVITYIIVLLGYMRWKKGKEEQAATVIRNTNKNIIKGSSIKAGGNVTIGDTTVTNQQNHSGSGDNIAGDKIGGDKVSGDKITYEYKYYGDRKIPRLLTNRPFYTDFFIGRDKDLAAIETAYKKDKHLLILVNGEGGMGKTTLAAQYWFQHEARYTHLAWVFADSGVGNALLSLAQSLGITFHPQDDERAQIARITEGVNQLTAPCLLVFDNANNDKDLEKHFVTLKKLTNCHILLTSRVTELGDAPVHRVQHLDKADAVKIFIKHYPKYQDAAQGSGNFQSSPNLMSHEATLLDSLLHAIGFNTLVIELLAKNLAVFNKFQTQYSLASLVADLQSKGLLALQTKAVKVVYQSDSLRTETPENIIAAMYDVSALTDTEKYLLSNFAVLPAENISYALFIELLKPEATETFDDPLSSLQQKGWIEYYADTADFKISPVIQDITKRKNKETLLNDCNTLIQTLKDKLHPHIIHEDNYKMAAVFSRYAETVVTAFDTPQYNLSVLCERIGIYHTTTGNLTKAMVFVDKDIEISVKLCEFYPDNIDYKNNLAVSYQYLGNTHTSLGNLDMALGFYEDASSMTKKLYAAYPTNVDFKNGLAVSYQNLGNIRSALGNLDKALSYYKEMNNLFKELYAASQTNVSFKNGLAVSYQYLGNTHTSLGNLDMALGFYEELNRLEKELYAAYPTNVAFKNGLAISYSKLGSTHTALGNLDMALRFFQNDNQLFEELYAAYPTNVEFKNGLAISYEKLGSTHTALGNLDKALGFYEERNRLGKELYAAYPTNVAFKNGLAISYQNLGNTHTSLGNLDKALGFYEDASSMTRELNAAYPNNVDFKNGLAISYQNLGNTHTSLGNLDKALGFYEDYNRLEKELYAAYPNNVDFKNNLAISYQYLGITHTSLGNLDKALGFYEDASSMTRELYAAYPNNVSFKNGLAISYAKLGVFSRDNLKDKTKARAYFKQAEALWQALVRDAPQFVEFQKSLGYVQDDLKDLD